MYTPRHLAERILTQRSAVEGERKHVTVLFVDLKGSMEIASDVDPEEWHAIMDRFFAIAGDAVHRYEGTVNQYTGDGVMALFGAPLALEDHAERACLAALALVGELERYADELKRTRGFGFAVRTGLNSGEVVVGRIGDDLRMDYTAQGHTVGLATRMEQLAHPGRIYLTEHTAALVGDRFRLRDLGPHNVRGVREPVRVFELEGAGAVRTRLELSRARGFSRLVGRSREAEAMAAALERAVAGAGSVLRVSGEAGVGKSRLCFELASAARARGLVVREAHALPYGRTVPFLPALDLLRGMLGISERDDADDARRAVAGTLLMLDRRLLDDLPLVFDFLGLARADEPVPRGDPDARRRRLFEIARTLLVAQAARTPQLLVVEDLHWVDAASEAFLRHLCDALPAARVLLLLNYRPEYTASWLDAVPGARIDLEPLRDDASAELLHELLGDDPSLAAVAPALAERAAGNPFFIEEMVRALADAGTLAGARGAYRLIAPDAALALPPTVQGVLAARIDRLGEVEKEVLQTAAVVGKTFDRDVLRRVEDLPDAELERALAVLERAEFLAPDASSPRAMAFAHPLTQEVAYRAQLASRRERVHAQVARALEDVHAGRTGEVAALIAHHHEHAGAPIAAARWSRVAAEHAMRNDVAEAVRLWRQARDFAASASDDLEATMIAVWSHIQLLNLGWRVGLEDAEARALYEEGLEIAKRVPDRSATAGVMVTYGALRGLSGDTATALELVTEAERLAREASDEGTRVATQAALAQTQIMAGRLREARAVIGTALATVEAQPGLGNEQTGFDTHTWFLAMRGQLLTEIGELEASRADLDLALDRARRLGEVETLGWAHEMRSYLARWFADRDGALAHAQQAVQIAERTGSAFSQTSAYFTLALVQRAAGAWQEARSSAAHVLDIIRDRRSFRHWEASALAQLGEIETVLGDPARGIARAREGLALAQARRARFVELIVTLLLTRALHAAHGAGALAEIQELLTRATQLVDATGAASWRALLLYEEAGAARLAGDETRALARMDACRAQLAAIGATALARSAVLSDAPLL